MVNNNDNDNKRTTHTLGTILMRLAIMSKTEFQGWLANQGYTKEEMDIMRNDIIRQRTEKPAPFSYGKVY